MTYSRLDCSGPNPYVSYGVPASDYPFFAKAAIGKNLWTVPVGTSFSYVPYFSDWHFGGNVAYVFSEKALGINVDYWLVDGVGRLLVQGQPRGRSVPDVQECPGRSQFAFTVVLG
jgi:hypothetical protein